MIPDKLEDRKCFIKFNKKSWYRIEKALGWKPVVRGSKNRYLYLLPSSKVEKKKLIDMCKYDLMKKC